MTAINPLRTSRNLVLAGLALFGTVASFSATVSPAQAASPRYTAKLSTAVAAPARKVVNGVIWNCTGDTCSGPVDGARALNTCAQVVKAFRSCRDLHRPQG